MSATSYCSVASSQPPGVHLPRYCGGNSSYFGDYIFFQLFSNATKIIHFFGEVLRIALSSQGTVGVPMPESGDIEVLTPSVSRAVGVLARRRVGLSLDFSDISSDDLVTKRCKMESMNIQINNGPYPLNGSPTLCHRVILPSELASRVNRNRPVLILDCRPFFAYNANHIQGAVNINCSDRFNRRRLLQGKCTLVDLMNSKEGKDLYKKRNSKEIVVYDDRTKELKDVASDASMYVVLSVLRREGKQASILKGKVFRPFYISLFITPFSRVTITFQYFGLLFVCLFFLSCHIMISILNLHVRFMYIMIIPVFS